MTQRRLVTVLSASALLALAAACGTTESAAPAPTVPATTTVPGPSSSSAPGTVTESETTTPTSESDSNCLFGELAVALDHVEQLPGQEIVSITFTNTGTRTCAIVGYPGVTYVGDQGGPHVGKDGVRNGDDVPTVALAPGEKGYSALTVNVATSYPEDLCGPTIVAGFDVIPPNTFDSVFVPFPTSACTTDNPSVVHLYVSPVTR